MDLLIVQLTILVTMRVLMLEPKSSFQLMISQTLLFVALSLLAKKTNGPIRNFAELPLEKLILCILMLDIILNGLKKQQVNICLMFIDSDHSC